MESKAGKYLTFFLKDENYGIPIESVKEIIALLEITEVPKTPDFIRGVINLRGKIIPVMDLRLKLGFEEKEYNERTCIIVVEINTSKIEKKIGIVVDTVSEVLDIKEENIEEFAKNDTQMDGDFIVGIGKLKGHVTMLLNVEKIIEKKEIEKINNIDGGMENV